MNNLYLCNSKPEKMSLFNFEYLYFFIQNKIKIPAISTKNFYKGRIHIHEISKKLQGGTTSSKLLFYGIFTCFQFRILNSNLIHPVLFLNASEGLSYKPFCPFESLTHLRCWLPSVLLFFLEPLVATKQGS